MNNSMTIIIRVISEHLQDIVNGHDAYVVLYFT